jgi:hypothetical protein
VTDPSTRTILDDRQTHGPYGVSPALDFHVGVVMYRKGNQPRIVGAIPRLTGDEWTAGSFTPWRWKSWTEPRSHARLKPVYDSLRRLWQAAPAAAPALPGRRAPSN